MSAEPQRGRCRCLGPAGFHRIAYASYGDPDARAALVCVHGLTRNGEDFATLARALADRVRIVCVDVAGRGDSNDLRRAQDYGYALYQSDLATLLAHLRLDRVVWLGTSMGGILGMMMAAQPGTPLAALILNDIGPFVPESALRTIVERVARERAFTTRAELEGHVAEVYRGDFGPFSDEEWRAFVASSVRQDATGAYRLNYDPALAEPLCAAPVADLDLWSLWQGIAIPTLVFRGERSEILTADTARWMTLRGPRATLVEVPGVAHAPTLNGAGEIATVRDFLAGAL